MGNLIAQFLINSGIHREEGEWWNTVLETVVFGRAAKTSVLLHFVGVPK